MTVSFSVMKGYYIDKVGKNSSSMTYEVYGENNVQILDPLENWY